MNPTIDILRGELERLFTLEEMTSMSERLLGLVPDEVGGASAKGSFARALTERCFDGDRLDALVDVILHSRKEVDPRVRDISALMGKEELPVGRQLGDFTLQKKIGESDLGIVYQAVRTDGARQNNAQQHHANTPAAHPSGSFSTTSSCRATPHPLLRWDGRHSAGATR